MANRKDAGDWIDQHVEPGVRDVVRFLQRRRFNTCSSCEGGRGHPHERPQVSIVASSQRALEATRARVARDLVAAGYRNFSTTASCSYDERGRADSAHLFVEVEFFEPKPAVPRRKTASGSAKKAPKEKPTAHAVTVLRKIQALRELKDDWAVKALRSTFAVSMADAVALLAKYPAVKNKPRD